MPRAADARVVPVPWSGRLAVAVLGVLPLLAGCSIKTFAINRVGDALASGGSVYESDDDLALVGDALPFSLKLVESLLTESPRHRGLLLTACRGFVGYSYGYVHFEAERQAGEDLDRARQLRARARRLYLRGFAYGMRGLELAHPGLQERLSVRPLEAVRAIPGKEKARDVPLLYWSAAALGLAISVSKNDAAMLARLPEVEALLERALELDEAWNSGALHEFQVTLGSAKPGAPDREAIEGHHRRAVELSGGKRVAVHVALAEALSVPAQNREEFLSLVERALALDPDRDPSDRLANLLAQRRARWLMGRIDELFLGEGVTAAEEEKR